MSAHENKMLRGSVQFVVSFSRATMTFSRRATDFRARRLCSASGMRTRTAIEMGSTERRANAEQGGAP